MVHTDLWCLKNIQTDTIKADTFVGDVLAHFINKIIQFLNTNNSSMKTDVEIKC